MRRLILCLRFVLLAVPVSGQIDYRPGTWERSVRSLLNHQCWSSHDVRLSQVVRHLVDFSCRVPPKYWWHRSCRLAKSGGSTGYRWGGGDAAAMKAASHFLMYVFLSLPLFVVGFFAMRASRRRTALVRQESGKPSSAS